jgi:hypothetical protein
MLKRQRPATPPIPSMPLWAEPSSLDSIMVEREHKRRRTTSATPLDAPWKDWDNRLHAIANCADIGREGQVSYKSANATLRELHTLQQHRLLFSAPGTPLTHNSPFQVSHLFTLFFWQHLTTLPEQSKGMSSISLDTTNLGQGMPSIDEQMQVKERYEETNRYARN